MATTLIEPNSTHSAEIGARPVKPGQTTSFEIELSGGATRQFQSAEDIRDAILRGEVPKGTLIRKVGVSAGAQPATVENWARSSARFKALYAPVWSMTMERCSCWPMRCRCVESPRHFGRIVHCQPRRGRRLGIAGSRPDQSQVEAAVHRGGALPRFSVRDQY